MLSNRTLWVMGCQCLTVAPVKVLRKKCLFAWLKYMSNQESLQSTWQACAGEPHLFDKTKTGVLNESKALAYWHKALELSFSNLSVCPGHQNRHQWHKSVNLLGISQRITEAYGGIFCEESKSAKKCTLWLKGSYGHVQMEQITNAHAE